LAPSPIPVRFLVTLKTARDAPIHVLKLHHQVRQQFSTVKLSEAHGGFGHNSSDFVLNDFKPESNGALFLELVHHHSNSSYQTA